MGIKEKEKNKKFLIITTSTYAILMYSYVTNIIRQFQARSLNGRSHGLEKYLFRPFQILHEQGGKWETYASYSPIYNIRQRRLKFHYWKYCNTDTSVATMVDSLSQ